MPYRIRWEGHGVYRRFFGVVTRADFHGACEEMCADVRYEDIRYIISDYLEARVAPDLGEQDLKAFAKLERRRYCDNPDIVQAMVAMDPKIVAYLRYYESLGVSPCCVQDFSTVEDARHWIASHPRHTLSRPDGSVVSTATGPHR
jgi:hypothetical protein